MTYQLIVFDWDGTLMDSEARIVSCLQSAAKDLDLELLSDNTVKDIIGLGLDEAILRLHSKLDTAGVKDMRDRYRHHFFNDDIEFSTLFDGAEQVLHDLDKAEYMLAVATGKSRRGLDAELDKTGLGSLFLTSRCADEAFSKPNPQMLIDILVKLGIDAKDTLVIGDTEYDMQMANNAGVDCLGVSYGVHTKERLLEHGALGCLDAITELPKWLETGVSK